MFNNKKFWEYITDIYPSQLNVEKTNQSDDLASYFDLIFSVGRDGNFLPMTSISILSMFHPCQVIFHLALLIVSTSRSSLYIQGAAHTMMISDIAIKLTLFL